MLDISAQLKGLDKAYKLLGKIKGREMLKPPMKRTTLRLVDKLKRYPPKPSWVRYVRTGTLGRSWTEKVDLILDGVEGRVGNRTRYAPDVQHKGTQRLIFKRIGWPTDEDVLKQELSAIIKDFQKAIDEELKK